MCYRDNVCAVVRRREDGKVLVCHRSGYPFDEGWQFPQGGFNKAKELISELKRELREEIGTDNIEVVTIAPDVYSYDFPPEARACRPRYKGQRQRWVLADFKGDDRSINFARQPAEFDNFEWVEPREAVSRIIDFKKAVYNQALIDLGLIKSA